MDLLPWVWKPKSWSKSGPTHLHSYNSLRTVLLPMSWNLSSVGLEVLVLKRGKLPSDPGNPWRIPSNMRERPSLFITGCLCQWPSARRDRISEEIIGLDHQEQLGLLCYLGSRRNQLFLISFCNDNYTFSDIYVTC